MSVWLFIAAIHSITPPFEIFKTNNIYNMNVSITKWLLPFCLLLFIPYLLPAQQDSISIQEKIMQTEESEQIQIQRTRNFILNRLKAGNIDEAFEAYNYVVQKYENEQVKPFFTNEKFLLSYWFGKYNIVYKADSIENSIEREPWNSRLEYLFPQLDKLHLEIRSISSTYRSEIMQRIDSLVVNREEHDYLVLFFDWLTFNSSEKMTPKEEQAYLENNLTPRAEEYLNIYKDSRFRPFVQRHFRHVYVLNDWGGGFYLGAGSLSPYSTAGLYLKPEFIFGVGFNLGWKNVLMDLGFDMGIPVSIRKQFTYQGKTWSTDIRHNYYTFFFTSGWAIAETRLFKLIPQIGIGGIHMSVCEADKDKAGDDFSMTQMAIQYGINYDIKLSINESFYQENIKSYSGLRLGIDYYQFLGNNPVMSGGMLRFRVSWIGFMRSIIRDI